LYPLKLDWIRVAALLSFGRNKAGVSGSCFIDGKTPHAPHGIKIHLLTAAVPNENICLITNYLCFCSFKKKDIKLISKILYARNRVEIALKFEESKHAN
jgi:hypothetical protein